MFYTYYSSSLDYSFMLIRAVWSKRSLSSFITALMHKLCFTLADIDLFGEFPTVGAHYGGAEDEPTL